MGEGWVDKVYEAKNLVRRGKEANDQINILGDDGVPMSYHERFWKSELIDFILLQQDGFDPVDCNAPMERQKYMLNLVLDICHRDFSFDGYEQCREYFKDLINLLKQMNYNEFHGEAFEQYREQLNQFLA